MFYPSTFAVRQISLFFSHRVIATPIRTFYQGHVKAGGSVGNIKIEFTAGGVAPLSRSGVIAKFDDNHFLAVSEDREPFHRDQDEKHKRKNPLITSKSYILPFVHNTKEVQLYVSHLGKKDLDMAFLPEIVNVLSSSLLLSPYQFDGPLASLRTIHSVDGNIVALNRQVFFFLLSSFSFFFFFLFLLFFFFSLFFSFYFSFFFPSTKIKPTLEEFELFLVCSKDKITQLEVTGKRITTGALQKAISLSKEMVNNARKKELKIKI